MILQGDEYLQLTEEKMAMKLCVEGADRSFYHLWIGENTGHTAERKSIECIRKRNTYFRQSSRNGSGNTA